MHKIYRERVCGIDLPGSRRLPWLQEARLSWQGHVLRLAWSPWALSSPPSSAAVSSRLQGVTVESAHFDGARPYPMACRTIGV